MKIHVLKCWPEYFYALRRGDKNFEFRLNDRGFEVKDILIIRKFLPKSQRYTGDIPLIRTVTYILDDCMMGFNEGFCIMSLKVAQPTPPILLMIQHLNSPPTSSTPVNATA